MSARFRLFIAAATLAVAAIPAPLPAAPAVGSDRDSLDQVVQTVTNDLHQSWRRDPLSASLPFPAVRLWRKGEPAPAGCTPSPVATYCPASNLVVLNRTILGQRYRVEGPWTVAFWLATTLGDRLRLLDSPATLSPAAKSLQATCLGGTLLADSPVSQPPNLAAVLGPSFSAYGARDDATRGTGEARAYAFLSGFGATALLCTASEMNQLAMSGVPASDQALADTIRSLVRGMSRLALGQKAGCRPKGPRTCPPSLSSVLRRPLASGSL